MTALRGNSEADILEGDKYKGKDGTTERSTDSAATGNNRVIGLHQSELVDGIYTWIGGPYLATDQDGSLTNWRDASFHAEHTPHTVTVMGVPRQSVD